MLDCPFLFELLAFPCLHLTHPLRKSPEYIKSFCRVPWSMCTDEAHTVQLWIAQCNLMKCLCLLLLYHESRMNGLTEKMQKQMPLAGSCCFFLAKTEGWIYPGTAPPKSDELHQAGTGTFFFSSYPPPLFFFKEHGFQISFPWLSPFLFPQKAYEKRLSASEKVG